MSIDMGLQTTPGEPTQPHHWPQRTTTILIGGLVAALIAALLVTLAALDRSTPPVRGSVPIVTRTVAINAAGDIVYYDLYGPGFEASGSDTKNLPPVPVGTRIVVIAIATRDNTSSLCSVKIDGTDAATMDGVGAGAVSECSATVH